MLTLAHFDQLREYDTALVANTLGRTDPIRPHEYYMSGEIRCLTPDLGPTVGLAVTCTIDSSTPEGDHEWDLWWKQLDDVAAMDLPAVWVAQTVGARLEHECVMGDGMAKCLYAGGCVGAVTNGGLRDIAGMLTVPFAAYARGLVIHHCAVRVKAADVPVSVGGITIAPGDVIHAGAEGVIKIPEGAVEPLIEKLPLARAWEQEVHAQWRRADIPGSDKGRISAELAKKYGF